MKTFEKEEPKLKEQHCLILRLIKSYMSQGSVVLAGR